MSHILVCVMRNILNIFTDLPKQKVKYDLAYRYFKLYVSKLFTGGKVCVEL